MQIVIDINENLYSCITKEDAVYFPDDGGELFEAVKNGTPLDRIRAEIEEKYGNCDICEWFENYDYEENDISEYQQVGTVSDILAIIDKAESEEDE